MTALNNPKTVQTARRKLEMIRSANTPDLCYELAMFMHGWLEALWSEGLIDRPTWDALRGEAEEIRKQRTGWLEGVAKYGEPAD